MQTRKRKEVAGPIRNKERTKNRLLDSIGQILAEETYSGLSISMICKKSGLNPKLVYLYFDGFDNLLESFLSRKLESVRVTFLEEAARLQKDEQGDILESIFIHLNNLQQDEILKKMLHWAIVEKKNKQVRMLMSMYDEHFKLLLESILPKKAGKDASEFASLLAVAISGMLYLSLHNASSSPFMGLNLTSEDDYGRLTNALRRMIEREIA